MTFHDEIRIALAIVAMAAAFAISVFYFHKLVSLTSYLDGHHPEYLNPPDLLQRNSTKWWYYGGYDRPQGLRSRRLTDLVLSAAPLKTFEHGPKLDALVLEVRCMMIVWSIAWALAMISLSTLPFQPPVLHANPVPFLPGSMP